MSDDRWSYQLFGQTFGPVPFETLADLAANGQIGPTDEVAGPNGRWQKAADIVGLIKTNAVAESSAPVPERHASVDDILSLAESVSASGERPTGSIAPQRQAVQPVATGKPKAAAPKQVATPRNEVPPATPRSGNASALPAPVAPPTKETPATAASIPSPRHPAPWTPPNKQRDLSWMKPAAIGVASVLLVAGLGYGAVSVIGSGASGSGNVVEREWAETQQLATVLLQTVTAGDPSGLPHFVQMAAPRSQAIITRLSSPASEANRIDPFLTDALLKIHQEAMPPLMNRDGWTDDNIAALKSAVASAKDAAAG